MSSHQSHIRNFCKDSVTCCFVNIIDIIPASGNLCCDTNVLCCFDFFFFFSNLLWSPVQSAVPFFNQLRIYFFQFRMFAHQITDTRFNSRCNICRSFCHPDKDCFSFFQPCAEVLLCICCIVQTCKRRFVTCYHNFTQAVKSKLHLLIIQLVCNVSVVFRLPFEELQCYFCDKAKSSFVSTDDMSDIRTCRTSWNVFDSADLSIREHSFHTNDHIFDSAIKCRELSDTSCCNKTADLCKRFGLRRMSCCVSLLTKHIVQILKRNTTLACYLHVVCIYFQYFIHHRTIYNNGVFKSCL